jgi:subtilisin family serine protease
MDSGFPGVNTTQPFARLRDSNKILGGYDFVLRNQNFYTSNSHGTMVLATMGGYTENQLVGTAPDASYYLFITENATTENPIEESLWVEAAEEADRLGVDIINTSLGYFEYDNPAYSHTYSRMNGTTTFISRGANIAFTRGMMVVVSAGNSGNSANPNIAAPADATNVLTVGAVDANKNYVTFSSRGPSFDGRTKPDVMAKGLASTVATPSGNISTASGTSFSSPIVAGMVACLWQALPNKSATQIMQMIKQSSDNFSTPNADLGFGIPDFAKALNSSLNIQSSTESQFRAYPNPTTSIINLEIQIMLENTEIKIFNNLGQLIIQKKCNQKTESISVENLPSGLYTYIINNNQQGKFLKH